MPSARKFSSQNHPSDNSVPLAPLRDDVALIDPCSGFLSPGAEVDLADSRRSKLSNEYCASSALWVPARHRKMTRTPQSFLQQTQMHLKRDVCSSSVQRSYEGNERVKKLPWQLKPLETTWEKMTDPVKQTSTLRRYHSRPQLWQSMGTEWERFQQRLQRETKKPITFCSPCRRTSQIPLYTGTIGAENMDQVDQSEEEFIPFTILRTMQPAYTPTAHRPNIPGYTEDSVFHQRRVERKQTPGSWLRVLKPVAVEWPEDVQATLCVYQRQLLVPSYTGPPSSSDPSQAWIEFTAAPPQPVVPTGKRDWQLLKSYGLNRKQRGDMTVSPSAGTGISWGRHTVPFQTHSPSVPDGDHCCALQPFRKEMEPCASWESTWEKPVE